ncbi:hypothetical protein DSM25558_0728 [Agrobacterium sp. DSM 25558]|nr:hypothetical protein DSM25558_0728 [Agrobacterium sp. DSM 25558]
MQHLCPFGAAKGGVTESWGRYMISNVCFENPTRMSNSLSIFMRSLAGLL